ncbi:hypothetical protein SCOR_26595 [Sulfidibacter corallicola]
MPAKKLIKLAQGYFWFFGKNAVCPLGDRRSAAKPRPMGKHGEDPPGGPAKPRSSRRSRHAGILVMGGFDMFSRLVRFERKTGGPAFQMGRPLGIQGKVAISSS